MFEVMKVSPMKGSENRARLDGKVVVITGEILCISLLGRDHKSNHLLFVRSQYWHWKRDSK